MKIITIYITFNTTFSLQCGGLERCRIWFHKPDYVFLQDDYEYSKLPFGDDYKGKRGLCEFGWRASSKAQYHDHEKGSMSLGKWLGYDNSLAQNVWDSLCEFFGNDDLRKWDEQEKKLNLHPRDWMYETKIKISWEEIHSKDL